MTATISLTEDQTLEAHRLFLLGLFGPSTVVVVGQDNRVPEPGADSFIVMTPIHMERLETNVVSYADGRVDDPVNGVGQRFDLAPQKLIIQLDVHGPSSPEWVRVIAAMYRTDYAVDAFAATGYAVTPLLTTEPRQAPFVGGEQQVEQCWMVDVTAQCNPVITTGQDFADQLTVGLIEVDSATYGSH